MNQPILFLVLSILISGTVQATPIYEIPLYPSPTGTSDGSELLQEHGGVITGNGGYTLRCSDHEQPQSYDYLAAQAMFGPLFDVREIRNTTESLQRIHSLIAKNLPALMKSYDEFVSQIYNEDLSKHYIWQSNKAPLYAGSNWIANYEFVSGPISLLCPGQDALETMNRLEQAVLRAPYPTEHENNGNNGTQVIFYFDPDRMDALHGTQKTFLLMHEWLWDYTNDLNSIIRADYLLHSTWIEKASSEEVIQIFNSLGIR